MNGENSFEDVELEQGRTGFSLKDWAKMLTKKSKSPSGIQVIPLAGKGHFWELTTYSHSS